MILVHVHSWKSHQCFNSSGGWRKHHKCRPKGLWTQNRSIDLKFQCHPRWTIKQAGVKFHGLKWWIFTVFNRGREMSFLNIALGYLQVIIILIGRWCLGTASSTYIFRNWIFSGAKGSWTLSPPFAPTSDACTSQWTLTLPRLLHPKSNPSAIVRGGVFKGPTNSQSHHQTWYVASTNMLIYYKL